MVDLESRGLPSVFIASTEFEEAAHRQALSLGYDPAVVFVPHPIQDRTDEEVKMLANHAIDAILAALVS